VGLEIVTREAQDTADGVKVAPARRIEETIVLSHRVHSQEETQSNFLSYAKQPLK
jgi:hypothetical protein